MPEVLAHLSTRIRCSGRTTQLLNVVFRNSIRTFETLLKSKNKNTVAKDLQRRGAREHLRRLPGGPGRHHEERVQEVRLRGEAVLLQQLVVELLHLPDGDQIHTHS